jgi:DNA-binding transcriptional LysR family regulator
MKSIQTTLPGLISAVQAADSGSFTAAAAMLDLSPAAVSKNIAKLETALKVRLFNRTTRKLSLTEEGRHFIAKARAGIEVLQDAAHQAAAGLKPQGLVRMNCPVGFGRRFVLPALPAFYAQFPDVQIELNLNDHAVDLVGEGFDLGIRGGSQPPEGMVARKICSISSVLVATPTYLKARGVPRRHQDLSQHDVLRVKFLNGRMLPWSFKETENGKYKIVTFEGQGKLIISDPEMILSAALQHMGIAGLGRYDAHDALMNGKLVEVLPDQFIGGSYSLSLFYPHRTGLAPRVRTLVDFLLGHLAKDAALQPHKTKRKLST